MATYYDLHIGAWCSSAPTEATRATSGITAQKALLNPAVTRHAPQSCLKAQPKRAKKVQWHPSVIFNENNTKIRSRIAVKPPPPRAVAIEPTESEASSSKNSAPRKSVKPPTEPTYDTAFKTTRASVQHEKETSKHSSPAFKDKNSKYYVPTVPPRPPRPAHAISSKLVERHTTPEAHENTKVHEDNTADMKTWRHAPAERSNHPWATYGHGQDFQLFEEQPHSKNNEDHTHSLHVQHDQHNQHIHHIHHIHHQHHDNHKIPPPAPEPPRGEGPPPAPRPARLPTPDLPGFDDQKFVFSPEDGKIIGVQAAQLASKMEAQTHAALAYMQEKVAKNVKKEEAGEKK